MILVSKPNYRQIYAKKAARENRIKSICPNIPNTSGIYAFHRVDEAGIKRSYVGQALHLCERCASHLGEYDHIALSLKKHGFYSEDNPYGWKLDFKTCPKSELDEKEVATIKQFADKGFQMYNVTAGSQGQGKLVTGQYKQPKTYTQGVQQGYKKASKEVAHLFELHLDYKTKSEPPNKNQEKALNKFLEFLNYCKGDSGNG
nr:MAG TPA: intron-associated endonuclease 1 [Bacteriophage sp.]